jgi:hypothetical protein
MAPKSPQPSPAQQAAELWRKALPRLKAGAQLALVAKHLGVPEETLRALADKKAWPPPDRPPPVLPALPAPPVDLDQAMIKASQALAAAAAALAAGDPELCERYARTAERLIQALARYRAQARPPQPLDEKGDGVRNLLARLRQRLAAHEAEARAGLLDVGWIDPTS